MAISEMSLTDLLMAKEQLEKTAEQLSATTTANTTLITGLINYLRGKKAVIIDDNNKTVQKLRTMMKGVKLRIKEIALAQRAKQLKGKKGVEKNGK
jgi:adenine/guanine phosphoribosyltransferase-like PRPP-binding protein